MTTAAAKVDGGAKGQGTTTGEPLVAPLSANEPKEKPVVLLVVHDELWMPLESIQVCPPFCTPMTLNLFAVCLLRLALSTAG